MQEPQTICNFLKFSLWAALDCILKLGRTAGVSESMFALLKE